ncbi:MAG: glycosyltransferase involved in cell wall biosynthesis [Granulosicoccus sp.]|jgi:glycosyltransferase involved in cell wall biosynthesis
MSAKNPFFSIVLPTFNRAKLIEPAIKSVLGQTFPYWELIIIDDGSTDETEKVVKKYQDKRIKYFWKENEERGIARNFGVNKSNGKFICFLDSDDYYLFYHLLHLHQLIEQNKDDVFFQTSYQCRDASNNLLNEKILPAKITITDIAKCNYLSINGLCLDASIARQFPFPEDPKFSIGEDHYFWLTLLARYSLITTPMVTSVVVEHPSKTMNTIDPNTLLYSAKKITELMERDAIFNAACPIGVSRVVANWYSTATYFAFRNGQKKQGFQLLWQTFKRRPQELLQLRTLSMVYRFFKPVTVIKP